MVSRLAGDCVHKTALLSTSSRDAKLRDLLGESAGLFLSNVGGTEDVSPSTAISGASGLLVVDLETNLITQLHLWLKALAV